jgi:hypothetical protein
MQDTTEKVTKAVSVPVPDPDYMSGYKRVDASVHFKDGAFVAFKEYVDKLASLGFEVKMEGSQYAVRDYPVARATADSLRVTVYGPDFPEPEPRPDEPTVEEKLAKAMIAENQPMKEEDD